METGALCDVVNSIETTESHDRHFRLPAVPVPRVLNLVDHECATREDADRLWLQASHTD